MGTKESTAEFTEDIIFPLNAMKHLWLVILFFQIPLSALGQLNVWRWQNPSIQENTLNAVQMLSVKKTFACGNHGTVLRTTDGGLSWDIRNLLLKDSLNLYGLNFLDSNYGMLCGEGGSLFKTTDGGETWITLSSGALLPLTGITIIDHNVAIAVGLGGIMLTSDGGATWHSALIEGSAQFTGI
ncbi:MAG TPA: YCF48-related protein, partial [Bacteroidia bacterium]|nr:YCF48-related protein [Bacteroidia bacterium]